MKWKKNKMVKKKKDTKRGKNTERKALIPPFFAIVENKENHADSCFLSIAKEMLTTSVVNDIEDGLIKSIEDALMCSFRIHYGLSINCVDSLPSHFFNKDLEPEGSQNDQPVLISFTGCIGGITTHYAYGTYNSQDKDSHPVIRQYSGLLTAAFHDYCTWIIDFLDRKEVREGKEEYIDKVKDLINTYLEENRGKLDAVKR